MGVPEAALSDPPAPYLDSPIGEQLHSGDAGEPRAWLPTAHRAPGVEEHESLASPLEAVAHVELHSFAPRLGAETVASGGTRRPVQCVLSCPGSLVARAAGTGEQWDEREPDQQTQQAAQQQHGYGDQHVIRSHRPILAGTGRSINASRNYPYVTPDYRSFPQCILMS